MNKMQTKLKPQKHPQCCNSTNPPFHTLRKRFMVVRLSSNGRSISLESKRAVRCQRRQPGGKSSFESITNNLILVKP